jgi:ribA/ribD-fused uncharacterized protein
MKTGSQIDRFIDEHWFLSNFYPASVWVDGERYPTLEHAYQAAKTDDPIMKKAIREAKTPALAKRIGKSVTLRPGWNDVRVQTMRELVKQKFSNPLLAAMLINTGNAELIEGNHWNDKFWGICRGVGENWLGKILMEVRDEINNQLIDEFGAVKNENQ